jgi:uncharacterized DUF497 family protein
MPAPISFEWDDAKDAANAVKHGISFFEATAVFADSGRIDFDATHPEDGEERRKVVGRIEGRLFVVVYTVRGGRFRIISARRANAQETHRHGQD